MKLRFWGALILSAAAVVPVLAQRSTFNINQDWSFFAGDAPGAEALDFDDSSWNRVNVPHDFQIHQPWVEPASDEKPDMDNPMANVKSRLSSRGFKEMGTGWYRRTLAAPEEWRGRRVLLDFEGIMLVGDVYLNGELVGGTDYGYLGFEIDVSDKLVYGGNNVIAVRADTGKPENSRWYTGCGLYRDVKVTVTDPDQYFMRHPLSITTPKADEKLSTVVVGGEIASFVKADSISVGIEIFDKDGRSIYSETRRHWTHPRQHVREYCLDSISVVNADLWDCDSPSLYTMEATLYRNDGSVADRVRQRFGIRQIEFSPEFGFKLNGKKVLLKGIANHHTLGALGAAAYPRAIEKRIQLLKEFGFNHIRTSHNPYSESFMDLCDEYGMLVVDELYDKWTTQYAGGRKDWSEQWQKDVPEWVRRDRNHPSVIIWSLGNELQLIPDLPFNDWGVTPYRLQKALLKRYDDTRPVTVAMHPRGRDEHTDSLPAPLVKVTDIAAYNYRYMYFPGDSKKFPWMMFYQSEANTSGMGPNYYEMDLDKVIGLAYWGMIDYLGESNGWPAKGWTQGVFDIALTPKPAAYFLKSIFKPEEPVVHIGIVDRDDNTVWNDVKVGTRKMSSHWNRAEGCIVSLYTFTNADEVELIVNGRSFGRKVNEVSDPKRRNRIYWDSIPYKKGYIEARAYNKGQSKPVKSHRLETSGKAVKLMAVADNEEWTSDGLDLQHVKVTAVDARGRQDYGASGEIKFDVEGPAEIVGVINGDIYSEELTVGNVRRMYDGEVTVILRSLNRPGDVVLKAFGPDDIRPVTLMLKAH